ncbi:MAG: glycosyltransferase family 39 protein [Pseudomonadota bacterium]|nr:glycosyltransferase family 39 protein [Pseudomonadota bacterium]
MFDVARDEVPPAQLAWRYFGVFCAALAIRVVNFWLIDSVPEHVFIEDSAIYWGGAAAWLAAGFFAEDVNGQFLHETERLPGYYLYLMMFRWAFADGTVPAIITQLLIDSGTCAVIAVIGSRLGRDVGMLAGLLAILWPNLIVHCTLILSDSLFLFFLTLTMLFTVRACNKLSVVDIGLAGVLCGIAILIRPVAQLFPLIIVSVVLFTAVRQRWKWKRGVFAGVVFIVAVGLPLSSIISRNLSQFDTLQLTSQGGTHLLHWVAGYSRALDSGTSFGEETAKLSAKLSERKSAQEASSGKMNAFEYSKLQTELALEEMKQTPVRVLAKAWVSGMVLNYFSSALLGDPRVRRLNSQSFFESKGAGLVGRVWRFLSTNDSRYVTIVVTALAASFIAGVLQVIGFVYLARYRPWLSILAAMAVFYFLLINGPVAGPKYRLPFEPVLIILQSIGLIFCWRFLRRRGPSA